MKKIIHSRDLFVVATLGVNLIFSSFSYASYAGGDVSGGGSIVAVNGRKVLLDLYVTAPNDPMIFSKTPGIQLPKSKALKSIWIDRLNRQNIRPLQVAHDRLKVWQASSPNIVGLIREALERASIFYIPFHIAFVDQHYFIPNELKNDLVLQTIQTIAYYSEVFGILVSKPDFDSLDELSQAAVLIKESMRHVQIAYGFHMSNESVQKIIAAIILHSPSTTESLDSDTYLDGKLLRQIQAPSKDEKRFIEMVKILCELAKVHKDVVMDDSAEKILRFCEKTAFSSQEDVQELSIISRDLSKSIGDIRFKKWDQLSKEERLHMENAEWALLNCSSEAITMHISFGLNNLGPAIRALRDATQDVSHWLSTDLAIDEANRGIGWFTGSRSSIRASFNTLIKNGFLNR